jgi:hypothetical protein
VSLRGKHKPGSLRKNRENAKGRNREKGKAFIAGPRLNEHAFHAKNFASSLFRAFAITK